MDKKAKARELFLSGYNCAQSTFCVFCEEMGLDFETALKLASSFGGGMGRMREVCGACSGMFMTAGMLYGYTSADNQDEKLRHYALVQQLANEFKEKHGTIVCRELLAALKPGDTPEATPRTDDFYKIRPCLRFVEDAAEIMDSCIKTRGRG